MGRSARIRIEEIPEGFEERRFDTGEVTLDYVVGPARGLPLLLVPGQMESWHGYQRVLPELSRRFHVHVPDLRGHGKSSRTPGRYSYERCGRDLERFIQGVIRRPTLVAGLSSGAVLAIWLAANVPSDVLAIISEDPPIFSSVWPRIRDEKYLSYVFAAAIETLGGPGERDLEAMLMRLGVPVEGSAELRMIPPFAVKVILAMFRLNRALRPHRPYDVPLLPFNLRASLKFWSEYDPDFSRATLDGDLSEGFSPEQALRGVRCPMLLLRVPASRHETWGILGAIDDDDLRRIEALVDDLRVVEIPGKHEIHMESPERYVEELTRFVDELSTKGVLPVVGSG